MNQNILIIIAALVLPAFLFAGNPDRQGQAGAYELLINPWARSAGLSGMVSANVAGTESMMSNVAGLANIRQTELNFSHTRYLVGTELGINSFGFAQNIGGGSVLGISIMAMDFGDIPVTTTEQPEGTGATFSPRFFNLGLGYAYRFENMITVGALMRVVSQGISNVSATTICFDAGIQYVTGPRDNIRFGISLRNVGAPMQYRGEGLSFPMNITTSNGTEPYQLYIEQRPERFELPSMLNIAGSYDFEIGETHRITPVANFTSNSFARDLIGGGIEYAFNEMFMLRAGYNHELDGAADVYIPPSVFTGFSAGVTVEVPVRRNSENRIGIDYAYRTTNPWSGTHNLGIRLSL
jgi:hypothetical protein